MGFINDELTKALFTGNYICPKCGGRMIFEDEEWRDILICPTCGESADLDEYGVEDVGLMYPTKDEVVDDEEGEDNDN